MLSRDGDMVVQRGWCLEVGWSLDVVLLCLCACGDINVAWFLSYPYCMCPL